MTAPLARSAQQDSSASILPQPALGTSSTLAHSRITLNQHRGEDPLRESEQIARKATKQQHNQRRIEEERVDDEHDEDEDDEEEEDGNPQLLHKTASTSRPRTGRSRQEQLTRGRAITRASQRGKRTESVVEQKESGTDEQTTQQRAAVRAVAQPHTLSAGRSARRGTRPSSMRAAVPEAGAADDTQSAHTSQAAQLSTTTKSQRETGKPQEEPTAEGEARQDDGRLEEEEEDGEEEKEETSRQQNQHEDEADEDEEEQKDDANSEDEEEKPSRKRQKRKWTDSETQALIAGMDKFAEEKTKWSKTTHQHTTLIHPHHDSSAWSSTLDSLHVSVYRTSNGRSYRTFNHSWMACSTSLGGEAGRPLRLMHLPHSVSGGGLCCIKCAHHHVGTVEHGRDARLCSSLAAIVHRCRPLVCWWLYLVN